MSTPKSFVSDDYEPPSFEGDPPTALATVASSSLTTISRFGGIEVSGTLQSELDHAIESPSGGVIYNWFKRARSTSRTKTNLSRAAEIASIAAVISTYATETSRLQRLPHVIQQQNLVQDAQLRNQILQLDNEQKMVIVAGLLIQEAATHKLPLDKYLAKLDKDLEIDHQTAVNTETASHDRQMRTNARSDDRQRAEDKIAILTTAKNARRQQEKQLYAELDRLHDEEDGIFQDNNMSERRRANKLAAKQAEIESVKKQINELGQDPREADTRQTA